MKTKGLFIIVFILFGQFIYGQQEELFSNYMLNPSSINPGYTGTRGQNTLYFQTRNQWLGIDGAPKTSYFNYQGYNAERNFGFGLNFISDKIGLLDNTKITVDWSYVMKVSENINFSLGLRNGFKSMSFALDKLNIHQVDPSLENIDKNNFTYELGLGMFLYNSRSYLGFSAPNINASYSVNKTLTSIYKNVPHLYLMGGKLIDVNENIVLKPSFFARRINSSKTQVDLTLNALFDQKYQLGGSYRTSNAFNLMTGFQYNPNVFVGYSYDKETTIIGDFSKGSHELYIRYEFGNRSIKVPSPRFF